MNITRDANRGNGKCTMCLLGGNDAALVKRSTSKFEECMVVHTSNGHSGFITHSCVDFTVHKVLLCRVLRMNQFAACAS